MFHRGRRRQDPSTITASLRVGTVAAAALRARRCRRSRAPPCEVLRSTSAAAELRASSSARTRAPRLARRVWQVVGARSTASSLFDTRRELVAAASHDSWLQSLRCWSDGGRCSASPTEYLAPLWAPPLTVAWTTFFLQLCNCTAIFTHSPQDRRPLPRLSRRHGGRHHADR